MPRVVLRSQPCIFRAAFDDQRHGLIGEALRFEVAVAIDGSEDWPTLDAALRKPVAQRAHRAGQRVRAERQANLAALGFLVGLRAAQLDDQAVGGEADIGDVERDELAAAEGAGEADQQQRPIARRRSARPVQRLDHGPHLGGDGRFFWAGAEPSVRRMPWKTSRTWASRVGESCASGLVGLRDAAQAAVQRRDLVGLRTDRSGTARWSAARLAGARGDAGRTTGEIVPVDAVGLERVGRLGALGEVVRLVGDATEPPQRTRIAVDSVAIVHVCLPARRCRVGACQGVL